MNNECFICLICKNIQFCKDKKKSRIIDRRPDSLSTFVRYWMKNR